jgi:hypothetical protein
MWSNIGHYFYLGNPRLMRPDRSRRLSEWIGRFFTWGNGVSLT